MNTADKADHDNKYLVYCHKNILNGKLYFGITRTSLYMRFRNGRGYKTQIFGRAIQKYGWDSFEHIVLFENISKEVACECEKYLIAKYNTTNPEYGYNIANGGDGNPSLRSKESNLKRSLVEKGKKHWHYGKKWSPDVIAKLHKPHPSICGDNNPTKRSDVKQKLADRKREWHKLHPDFKATLGYKCSDATKKKISEANKGENNGNYGKHWYNNGIMNVFTYECPEGYMKGRLVSG